LQDLMGKANYVSFLKLGRQMFEPAD
jgi:hypothetical protein